MVLATDRYAILINMTAVASDKRPATGPNCEAHSNINYSFASLMPPSAKPPLRTNTLARFDLSTVSQYPEAQLYSCCDLTMGTEHIQKAYLGLLAH